MIRPVRPDGKIETGGVLVPILRRRVVDRIASAAMQRVVLIVAPAGYGKSVALRHYLDELSEQHVRYDVLSENAGSSAFCEALPMPLPRLHRMCAVRWPVHTRRTPIAGAGDRPCVVDALALAFVSRHHRHRRLAGRTGRSRGRALPHLIDRTHQGRVQWIIASRATSGLPIGTWLAYGESDLAMMSTISSSR